MTRHRKHEDIHHLSGAEQQAIRKQRWLHDKMSDPHQAELIRERNRLNKQAQRERAKQAASNDSEPPQKRARVAPVQACSLQAASSSSASNLSDFERTLDPRLRTLQPAPPIHANALVSTTPLISTSVGVITDTRTLADKITMTDMDFRSPATMYGGTSITPESMHPATPSMCPSVLSDLTDVNLDLATDLIGSQVPMQSGTVQWSSGHTTILPCVLRDGVNICEDDDVRFVKYLAWLPESTAGSEYVVHIEYGDIHDSPLHERIASALSMGKSVVVRGATRPNRVKGLTVDYLEEFGISRNMGVTIHDAEARIDDFQYPHKSGTIEEFIRNIDDPSKIQCILDIPLAHMGLNRDFWLLDHGTIYGWNQSTRDCPVLTDRVHPDNFLTRSWGLLHQGGYITFPHHDADGANTFLEMQFGVKLWALFWPKEDRSRVALSKAKMDLASMSASDEGGSGWVGEVVMLGAGDMLFQPPGQMHAVYTPVPSFATGGHFFHYNTMHLTEASRYVDSKKAGYLTNQAHAHALETFQRMVIALPSLPPRLSTRSGSLIGLCLMVLQPKLYMASNSDEKKIRSSQSTKRAIEMCTRFLSCYSGDIEAVRQGYHKNHISMPGEDLLPTTVAGMLTGQVTSSVT